MNNPKKSLNEASLDLNLSKTTIRRCLKKLKLHPFKAKFLHTLEPGDENLRMEYCLWAQGEFLNNPNFLNKILFTDEATFSTNGVVCSQNNRFWSRQNPDFIVNCKRQYSNKINVFCGIFGCRLIGPFFFEHNLNAAHFLNFLENEFFDAIEDLPLNERLDMHVQLDGAPIHAARPVVEWLNRKFPNKWIGRHSPLIRWPPRSPDITPLDFYLWGKIKNKVYAHRPNNLNELRQRIIQACNQITRGELLNVSRNNRKRIEKCIRLQGDLVEKTTI